MLLTNRLILRQLKKELEPLTYKKILESLQEEYSNRGINLVCISNKWIFRTAQDLSKLMSLQKSTQKNYLELQ